LGFPTASFAEAQAVTKHSHLGLIPGQQGNCTLGEAAHSSQRAADPSSDPWIEPSFLLVVVCLLLLNLLARLVISKD
jgi:hypothetical protein